MITVAYVERQERYRHNNTQDFYRAKEAEQTRRDFKQFVHGCHLVHWNITTFEETRQDIYF